jgi:hypothetical protein
LRDAAAAEAYCAQGGVVIAAKTAVAIGETYSLQAWAALGARGPRPVDEALKRRLLKVLMEVYMSGGCVLFSQSMECGAGADGIGCRETNAEQTAKLLNSQAMNIDVLDVAELLPDEWKLASTSGFLVRSLRRQLHARHENMIVKSIAMGQNLGVICVQLFAGTCWTRSSSRLSGGRRSVAGLTRGGRVG